MLDSLEESVRETVISCTDVFVVQGQEAVEAVLFKYFSIINSVLYEIQPGFSAISKKALRKSKKKLHYLLHSKKLWMEVSTKKR